MNKCCKGVENIQTQRCTAAVQFLHNIKLFSELLRSTQCRRNTRGEARRGPEIFNLWGNLPACPSARFFLFLHFKNSECTNTAKSMWDYRWSTHWTFI